MSELQMTRLQVGGGLTKLYEETIVVPKNERDSLQELSVRVDLPNFPVQELNYPILLTAETSEIVANPSSSSSKIEVVLGEYNGGLQVVYQSLKAPTTIPQKKAQTIGWVYNPNVSVDYPWNYSTFKNEINVYFYATTFNQFSVTVRLYGIA